MAKFEIQAKRLHEYKIVVIADDEDQAYHMLDDMIADDFEPFEVNAQWDIEVWETDDDAVVNWIDDEETN